MLALPPPWRLFQWITLAANPAALTVLLLAQAAPLPPPRPAVAGPPLVQPRSAARRAPAPAAAPVAAPTPTRPATARSFTPPPPRPQPPVQRYEFEDDQVDGEMQNPDHILVTTVRRVPHSSLIEIPGDFVVAVAKSLEDL
jgi:hypothetical protein